jgi:hypothetical protein
LTQTFSQTTTQGSSLLQLPTDLVRVIGVFDSANNRTLASNPFVEVQQYSTKTGNPLVFAVDESTSSLLLYPTPESAVTLTIRYFARPTEMSAEDSRPSTPAAYQDVLVSFALSRAFRAEDDFEASTFYKSQYMEDMARAATDLQYRDMSIRQVPGTWGR